MYHTYGPKFHTIPTRLHHQQQNKPSTTLECNCQCLYFWIYNVFLDLQCIFGCNMVFLLSVSSCLSVSVSLSVSLSTSVTCLMVEGLLFILYFTIPLQGPAKNAKKFHICEACSSTGFIREHKALHFSLQHHRLHFQSPHLFLSF